MQRRSPAIMALIAVLGMSALAYHEVRLDKSRKRADSTEKDAQFASAAEAIPEIKAPDESSISPASAPPPAGPPPKTSFHLLPDGSPVPPLGDSSPRRIKLGVALFRYKGAQGASSSTRSKEEATVLAQNALSTDKDNFAALVKKGDRGSQANIGWIKRRVLERSIEYAVFSLKKGEVTPEPLDTPTGLWVAKRLR